MWIAIWIVGLWGCCVTGERVWSVGEAVRVGAVVMGKVLEGVKVDGGEEGVNLVSLMMKLMGVDPMKMEKFALEGFISLVQLMSRVLIPDGTTRRQDRSSSDFSLFHFIVTQSQVADLLAQMQEPNLMDHLLLQNNLPGEPGEDTDCIRLLLCKTQPFVRGMQKAVRFFLRRENVSVEGGEWREEESGGAAWEKAGVEERMYFFMPGLEEVVKNGDRCDELYKECVY